MEFLILLFSVFYYYSLSFLACQLLLFVFVIFLHRIAVNLYIFFSPFSLYIWHNQNPYMFFVFKESYDDDYEKPIFFLSLLSHIDETILFLEFSFSVFFVLLLQIILINNLVHCKIWIRQKGSFSLIHLVFFSFHSTKKEKLFFPPLNKWHPFFFSTTFFVVAENLTRITNKYYSIWKKYQKFF